MLGLIVPTAGIGRPLVWCSLASLLGAMVMRLISPPNLSWILASRNEFGDNEFTGQLMSRVAAAGAVVGSGSALLR